VPSEETAPDFTVGVTPSDAEHLGDVHISQETSIPSFLLRYFIDGVQRTVPICLIPVGNLRVPVYVAHLIAGAMQRVNGKLSPFIKREAIILYFPLEGIRSAQASIPSPLPLTEPPFTKLDYTGNIYQKIIQQQQPTITFWTDFSVKLSNRRGDETSLDPSGLDSSKLSAIGAVRRAARDRSQVLLRIMELGIVWEIVNHNILRDNEFMVLDGPVFLPFKYATLTSQRLAAVMDLSGEQIGNAQQMYNLLCHLIGVVKTVQVVPAQGLITALSPGPGFTIPVYLFSTTVRGANDEVSRHTLACFVWLRRELSGEISPIWSPSSELVRIDIPFPAVIDPETSNWHTIDFRPNISQGEHRQKIEAILSAVLAERWPIPETTPHRMLTELYPIAETERWLRAHLMPEQELRRLAGI
jgi:hypothetical protein